jgi:phosphatidate cytidylyltransferase
LILIGLIVGVSVIMGDLIESALKRSATSKDSGSLIPGRGGVLDSIDSVLYAAPVFYYLFRYAL